MIITVTLNGLIICAILFIWAQLMKFLAKKLSITFVSNYLPLMVLVLSYIIYAIYLKSFTDPILTSLATTAVCCYAYDLYKAIKELISSIISKIRINKTKSKE